MKESDIEDYVRWFTKETEWGDWDAPWEPFEGDEESECASWTEYFESVKNLPKNLTRWKFEIERNGVHIGWVSFYTDLEWMENEAEIPAIGIDIPEQKYRRNGVGTKALIGFMEYLKAQGHEILYTQTWSGNMPMLRMAEKLGFREIARKRDYREVRGKMYDALTFQLEL
jgi:RimJ/RimL family protein N-acetyltransferase